MSLPYPLLAQSSPDCMKPKKAIIKAAQNIRLLSSRVVLSHAEWIITVSHRTFTNQLAQRLPNYLLNWSRMADQFLLKKIDIL